MNGRDSRGRFTRGNPGGPGRPPRATETQYLLALSAACPPETWAAICRRAMEQATEGDAAARAWLSTFLVGDATLAVAIEDAALEDEIAAILAER
jgi:hypothetical protein